MTASAARNVLAFRRPSRDTGIAPAPVQGHLPWMSLPTDPSFSTDKARRLAFHLGISEGDAGWAITNIWRWATNARRDGYLGDTDGVDLLIEGRLETVLDGVRAGDIKEALTRAGVIEQDGFLTDWNLLGGRVAKNAADRHAAVTAPVTAGARARRNDFPTEEAWSAHQRMQSAERTRRRRDRQRQVPATDDTLPADPVTFDTLVTSLVTPPDAGSVTGQDRHPDQRHGSPRLKDSGEGRERERDGAIAVQDLPPSRLRSGTPEDIPASRRAYVDTMHGGGVKVLVSDRVVAGIVDPEDVETAVLLAEAMLSVDQWGSARLKANPNLRWVSEDLGKYRIHRERIARLAADAERRRQSVTAAGPDVTERVECADVIDPEWPNWFVAWRGAVKSTATGGLWAFARAFRPDPSGTVQIIVPNRFAYVQIMKGTHLDALRAVGELADISIGPDSFRCADGPEIPAREATRPGSSGRLIDPAVLTGTLKGQLASLIGTVQSQSRP